MNRSSVARFCSTGKPGFSAAISSDPKHRQVRKLEQSVGVRFTTVPCDVATNEGVVHARPGDAILTGIQGEHWRVSRAHFAEKYRPLPPTRAGEDGNYVSLGRSILAVQMNGDFEVQLADGVSLLQGCAGDWLVDYGDGSLGIVSQDIFTTTYEILT